MKQLKGPRTPGFVQKIQWSSDPIGYMDAAAQKFPDIFEAKITPVGNTQVLVSHPQAIQQIMTQDVKSEYAAPDGNLMRPVFGDESLLFQDPKHHLRQRKLLMPSFHGERMTAYGRAICNLAQQVSEELSSGEIFSARAIMEDISLEVILEVIFGLSEGERYQILKELLVYYSGVFQSKIFNLLLLSPSLQKKLGFLNSWQNFLHKRQQIDQLLYAEIKERRAKPDPERTDILSMLLLARDEDGERMSDVEIRDQLITLLLTGHETTATSMAWALYWIHYHPEIRAKLLKEIDRLGDSPDPMDIFRLPYLTAVCNETLRIYPVVPISGPRMVKESFELMGYEIQPGTALHCCIYLTHHREDLYPNSKQFQPERFIEHQFSPYEFIPFGGGSRRCLGAALAMFEMKLVIATILSRYRLLLADNKPVKPIRQAITLIPAGGVRMILQGQRLRQQMSQPVANPV
ncbi:cytochrome P450 [Pleurocapsa sp. PCC 7319]|uniref:cytochrome P450 n=1 Tax=Pleurocapsa sp. PCC 7319 TaxID=118161 RepID=UPI000346AFDE|nr:cytochrome P450 [Pleurocapsa sp. PCC 7319]